MEGKRVLRSLTPRNVLSFSGERRLPEFEPLNVLIGPNGAGKSNLIECLELIRSLPFDLHEPILSGGSMRAWLGTANTTAANALGANRPPSFTIESEWELAGDRRVVHGISIASEDGRPTVSTETVWRIDHEGSETATLYHYAQPIPSAWGAAAPVNPPVGEITLGFHRDQSVLAQRRDADRYPELAWLSDTYSGIRIYRNWTVAANAPVRDLQAADLPDRFLYEDFSNLNLILGRLFSAGSPERPRALEALRRVYEGFEDVRVTRIGDYLQLSLIEEGGRETTARRLSDGTLRCLALIAMLLHPAPPPLICIEEPELGLHPDAIPMVVELLREATERTQLIVTTHSADLVTLLGDVPEAVVMCERGAEGTTLHRLEPEKLERWLQKYALGDLWLMGEIGGTRW